MNFSLRFIVPCGISRKSHLTHSYHRPQSEIPWGTASNKSTAISHKHTYKNLIMFLKVRNVPLHVQYMVCISNFGCNWFIAAFCVCSLYLIFPPSHRDLPKTSKPMWHLSCWDSSIPLKARFLQCLFLNSTTPAYQFQQSLLPSEWSTCSAWCPRQTTFLLQKKDTFYLLPPLMFF